jgi:hypothetical protein
MQFRRIKVVGPMKKSGCRFGNGFSLGRFWHGFGDELADFG